MTLAKILKLQKRAEIQMLIAELTMIRLIREGACCTAQYNDASAKYEFCLRAVQRLMVLAFGAKLELTAR